MHMLLRMVDIFITKYVNFIKIHHLILLILGHRQTDGHGLSIRVFIKHLKECLKTAFTRTFARHEECTVYLWNNWNYSAVQYFIIFIVVFVQPCYNYFCMALKLSNTSNILWSKACYYTCMLYLKLSV